MRLSRIVLATAALLQAHLAAGQKIPTRTLVEDLRIDGSEQEWARISAIHVASNGSIFVVHGGDYWMSLFSPAGKFMKKFIRKGAGPGEAQAVGRSGLVADTLWVVDGTLERVSLFTLAGSEIRSMPVKAAGAVVNAYAPSSLYVSRTLLPSWILPNNVAIGGGAVPVRQIAAGNVTHLASFRMSWDGVVSALLVDRPFGRAVTMLHVEGQLNSAIRQPFAGDPAFAVSPDGSHLVVADATGDDGTIQMIYLNIRGDTVRRARVPYTPQPVLSRVVDSAVNALAVTAKRPGHESDIRALIKIPEYHYPIRTMLLERDGTAWIQLRPEAATIQWLVVSPHGVLREIVEVPGTTQIMLVDRGIWAVSRDADDVPSVVRLRRK